MCLTGLYQYYFNSKMIVNAVDDWSHKWQYI